MAGRLRVQGIVALLRFTAADVTAGRADAKIERRSTLLARAPVRSGHSPVEVRASRVRHLRSLLAGEVATAPRRGGDIVPAMRLRRFALVSLSSITLACGGNVDTPPASADSDVADTVAPDTSPATS